MALRRLVAGRALDFEQECHLWHHMTYFLAHDIVSGGGGVVAVRWLLSCNLCCHFLFKCVVNLSYQHIGMAPKKNPEGDGILATVIRRFEAGELDIPVAGSIDPFKGY